MKWILGSLLMLLMLSGCASLPDEEREAIVLMADDTVRRLAEKNDELHDELNDAVGYLVVDNKVVKIPVVGAGKGKGVVVDHATGHKTFVKVTRLEIGGGWGARNYKMLMVINDPALLKKVKSGKLSWELGAEASAGKASVEGSSSQVNPDKSHEVHTLSEGGASATYTLRAIRLKPYRD